MPVSQQPLATFAPNDVTIVISQQRAGISHVVAGFSEDSIVQIARQSETFQMYIGADDSPTRIYQANTAAQMTLSLQQTSESNDVLSQLYELDRGSRSSRWLFSFLVRDNSGRSYYFAEEAYIGNVPDSPFANSMQLREWVIHTPRLQSWIGGNNPLKPDTVSVLEALGMTIDPRWLPEA